MNFNTYTQKRKSDKVNDSINAIGDWIQQQGKDEKEVLKYIRKYLANLNERTKKSLYEHILNKTGSQLEDVNKKNDLMNLINNLIKEKMK